MVRIDTQEYRFFNFFVTGERSNLVDEDVFLRAQSIQYVL